MRSSSGLSPPVKLKLLVPTERSQRPLPHCGSLSCCASYPSPRASDCPHSGSATGSFVRTGSKLCPGVLSSSPYSPPLFFPSNPQALESPARCVCAPSAHRKASRAHASCPPTRNPRPASLSSLWLISPRLLGAPSGPVSGFSLLQHTSFIFFTGRLLRLP